MFSRGLAFCLVLGFASMAHAGAIVRLGNFRTESVPGSGNFNTVDNGPYDQGQFVQVEVFLSQTAGGQNRELRHVQLDFSASDFAETNPVVVGMTPVPLPVTHDLATDIRFWVFDGELACGTSTSPGCGAGHFFDFQFTSPPDRREVVSMTYYFESAANLKANPNVQRTMPAAGEIVIGRFRVQMPMQDGCYTLDALNAAQTNPDLGGADIRFGFGTDVNPDATALTTWRANLAAPNNITGTPVEMCVGSGPSPANFVSSVPVHTPVGVTIVPGFGTIWRTQKNVLRLTFSAPLAAAPTSSEIQINELLTGGAFGPNIASGFTYALESGGTVLKITETAASFQHRKWYAVRNTGGWAAANTFEAQYPCQVGDTNGDNRVTSADVLQANSNVPCLSNCGDQRREDVNADTRVTSADVLEANSKSPSLPVAKPSGH